MQATRTFTAAGAAALALVVGLAVAACGSSGGAARANPRALLSQTFSAAHRITSGVIDLAVTLDPVGSSTARGPISFSLSGPFQSRGSGTLPASDLTLSVTGPGRHGQLRVVSTGTAGYLVLQGRAYRLPGADFQRLRAGFGGVASGSGASSGGLRLDAQRWLSDPRFVGHDTVAGVPTTHLRARVNVAAMLSDLGLFLERRGAAGAGGTIRLPTSQAPRIASEVENPRADVWTGRADRALRRLTIALTVPAAGKASALPDGMTAAAVSLTLQYAQLNRPQSIAAPAGLRPFGELAGRVPAIAQQLAGSFALGGG